MAPAAAALWDSVQNGCTADEVLAHTKQSAHWHCNTCKHEWITTPNVKAKPNSGCPQCCVSGRRPRTQHPTFAQCQHPLLATEWDHDRNAADGLFPDKVTLLSSKKVHWTCYQCRLGHCHSWTATPRHRIGQSQGCPFCARKAVCQCNSLQTLFPSIAAEWNYDINNKTTLFYTAKSGCLV